METRERDLLELIASEVVGIKNEMIGIKDRIGGLEDRIGGLEDRMDKMDAKVTDIQLTLENETNKNIQVIAEGHLDLSRKLDNALKIENEKEMLLIRVNRLENEIRKLKERIEAIA